MNDMTTYLNFSMLSPWTPGDALQAEDRVRRIGQTKNVRSIWMTAFDIDEQIDNLIEHKSQNASTVVNSNRNSTSNDFSNISKAAPKISIRQLVQCIVANKKENAT
jgi:SNF2 family DNA or RNA helicase